MRIEKNISLKPYNTFNVEAMAKYFAVVGNTQELQELLNHSGYNSEKRLFIGGGSNILFTKDFDGIVIKLNSYKIKRVSETKENLYIQADSGVEWDSFVKYTIDNGISGIENLSLIPGNVGATPIQNIGAYGVEVKDFIESVNIIMLDSLQEVTLSNRECNFGYRDSIFKNELKNKFVITSVVFKFTQQNFVNLEYAPLEQWFAKKAEKEVTSKDVRNAIVSIRESKLPDPKTIGNAGSFFKNPIIAKVKYEELKTEYSDLNGYLENNSKMKISAGWLIEKCGLKGKRIGDVAVHEKQALVIVNYGNASGKEIIDFSKIIQNKVKNKFNIKLLNEVNII